MSYHCDTMPPNHQHLSNLAPLLSVLGKISHGQHQSYIQLQSYILAAAAVFGSHRLQELGYDFLYRTYLTGHTPILP